MNREGCSAAGALDTAFNGTGEATVSFNPPEAVATAVAVQSDGKVVVAGTESLDGINSLALARFNTDGTLDTTFGSTTSGKVVLHIGPAGTPTQVNAVAIQPDGKILVAGSAESNSNFLIVRFLPNGTLDDGFDKDGIVEISSFDTVTRINAQATCLALQKDGKIVVAGEEAQGVFNPNDNFAIARLNTDGSLDHSFDGDGKTNLDLGHDEDAEAVAIDYNGSASSNPDYGKIIVVGNQADLSNHTTDKIVIARFNSNGSLDDGFANHGDRTDTVTGKASAEATGVLIQSNGRIVVAGLVGDSFDSLSPDAELLRFTQAGFTDTSFGSGGHVEINFGGNDRSTSVIAGFQGKLIVAGNSQGKFAIADFSSNGVPDTVFGNGTGRVTTAFPDSVSAHTSAGVELAPAPGGKFVAAGGNNFSTARYFDRGPTISITPSKPDAFEAGKTPGQFIVRRAEALPYATSVFFTTSGTANSPLSRIPFAKPDYTGVTAPMPVVGNGGGNTVPFGPDIAFVTIPANQNSAVVTITPIDDTIPESNETAIFTLLPNPGYDIIPAQSSTTITIHDNDTITKTVTASADAYVKDGTDAGTNFGSSTQLEVKDGGSGLNRQAYLKFDLSSFSTVNSVKLNLFGELSNADTTNVLTQLFSVADTTWSESGINFNNKPAAGSTVLASATIVNTTPAMYTFDVTGYVKAQLAAGHKTVSFLLKNPSSSSPFAIFNSREAPANTPTLAIT